MFIIEHNGTYNHLDKIAPLLEELSVQNIKYESIINEVFDITVYDYDMKKLFVFSGNVPLAIYLLEEHNDRSGN